MAISDFDTILNEMRDYAACGNVPLISREGAALLAKLVRSHRPLHILEIGTAIGYTGLLMAACQPPGARLVTIEKDPARIKTAGQFLRKAAPQSRIELIEGDAGEIIPCLEGSFDFVFLDAAKGQYPDYLQKVIDKLAARAVVVADNVLFRGWVEPGGLNGAGAVPRRFRTIVKRLRQYLHFVRTDARFRTEIFACGDGVAVSYYDQNQNKEVGTGG